MFSKTRAEGKLSCGSQPNRGHPFLTLTEEIPAVLVASGTQNPGYSTSTLTSFSETSGPSLFPTSLPLVCVSASSQDTWIF